MSTAKYLLFAVCVLIGMISYKEAHTIHYTMTGTCEEKITSQDRNGRHIYYTILIRLENGEVIEKDVEPSAYVTYNKGGRYVFNLTKTDW